MMDSIVEQEYSDFIGNYGSCLEIEEKKAVSEQAAREVIKSYVKTESIINGIERLCEEVEARALFFEGIIPMPDEKCYERFV